MTKAKNPDKNPKLGKDVVYIDPDDEITTIIDKVESAKQKIVALVLPKRFSILQSVVNMRLLARSAQNADKNVVLITSESALLPLAGAAGLHVAKNLQSKPEVPPSPIADRADVEPIDADEADYKSAKLDHHRSVGELAAAHGLDEGEAIALDAAEDEAKPGEEPTAPAKSPKNKKLAVPNFDRFRLILIAGAAGLIGLIIFIILALTVLPKATIAIQTTSTPVSTEFTLTAADSIKALDADKKQIPASLKKSEQTANQKVQATGQKNLGQKASGDVDLKNCTDNKVTVPAGTGVISGGLTFITQSATSLDEGDFTSGGVCKSSGGHVDNVDVVAQNPGTKYNIGPSSFTVSGFSGVTGSSSSAMSGGTDNNVTTLTQQDVDAAKQKISSTDSDNFSKDFQKKLGDEGFYVLSSTLKISQPEVSSTPAVGTETGEASVTVKLTYTVLVVPKADLAQIISDNLKEQVDQTKQKLADEDLLKNLSVTVASQASPTNVTLNVSKETTAVPIIDVEVVKKQVGGKKDSQIKSMLTEIPGVKSVETSFSPFWVSKAPKKPGKITVKLTQAPSSQKQSGD